MRLAYPVGGTLDRLGSVSAANLWDYCDCVSDPGLLAQSAVDQPSLALSLGFTMVRVAISHKLYLTLELADCGGRDRLKWPDRAVGLELKGSEVAKHVVVLVEIVVAACSFEID